MNNVVILCSIVKKVVDANGQVQLKADVVNVTINSKEKELSGAQRNILKESLRQSISAKRAAERLKRMEQHSATSGMHFIIVIILFDLSLYSS